MCSSDLIGGTSEYVASSSGNYISGLSESLSFSCNAGDVITIYSNTTGGTFTILSGAYFCGHRIAGPERIAASEKVIVDYNNASGQSLNTSFATITGWTKFTDSHGAFVNGVFTFPRAGAARVEIMALLASSTALQIQLVQAGSVSRTIASSDSSGTGSTVFAKTLYGQAGDTLTFQGATGSGSASFTSSGAYIPTLSIIME